jgi:hypothetical protein
VFFLFLFFLPKEGGSFFLMKKRRSFSENAADFLLCAAYALDTVRKIDGNQTAKEMVVYLKQHQDEITTVEQLLEVDQGKILPLLLRGFELRPYIENQRYAMDYGELKEATLKNKT